MGLIVRLLAGAGEERRLPDERRGWIFFAVGAAFLWGGLALSIVSDWKSGRRSEGGGTAGSRQDSTQSLRQQVKVDGKASLPAVVRPAFPHHQPPYDEDHVGKAIQKLVLQCGIRKDGEGALTVVLTAEDSARSVQRADGKRSVTRFAQSNNGGSSASLSQVITSSVSSYRGGA